jgi:iron complex outermembrane receptor protein
MRFLQVAIALSTVTHLYSQEVQQPADQDSLKTHPSPEKLKEMVVQGLKPSAYGQPAATSITGLTAPIKELPVTVNTISARFLDDTSAVRLRDIVGYVPGVNASEDSGATGDLLNIRGFDFLYQTYINGMRNRTGFNASRRFDTIDRVEIFKGPGGVEFGAGDPGGFVNLVTKKPQETQSTTAGFEAGSYDLIRAFVDTTGPLSNSPTTFSRDSKGGITETNDDLGVFYRLIASGDSANSFRDAFHTDGYEIAPSLLWKYAPGSSVLVEFDYQFRDQPYDRGILYIEGAGFKDNFAPINTSYHEPDDYYNNTNTRTSVYWTNKINDTFTFRTSAELDTNRGRGAGVRSPYTYLLYKDGTNEWNGDSTLLRTTQNIEQDIWSVGIKPELLLNFDTGPVKNTGLLGFSELHTSTKTASQDGFDLRPIDFRVPKYG